MRSRASKAIIGAMDEAEQFVTYVVFPGWLSTVFFSIAPRTSTLKLHSCIR